MLLLELSLCFVFLFFKVILQANLRARKEAFSEAVKNIKFSYHILQDLLTQSFYKWTFHHHFLFTKRHPLSEGWVWQWKLKRIRFFFVWFMRKSRKASCILYFWYQKSLKKYFSFYWEIETHSLQEGIK